MELLIAYIDTSVFGAIYDIEDAYRVDVTKNLIDILKDRKGFEPYISNIVIEEVEEAPTDLKNNLKHLIKNTKCQIIYENEQCIELVNEYLKNRIVPSKHRDDARHIAVAVIHNMDLIITWNCRHMANVEKKRKINAVNIMFGYKEIDIVTPLEVVGYG